MGLLTAVHYDLGTSDLLGRPAAGGGLGRPTGDGGLRMVPAQAQGMKVVASGLRPEEPPV